MSENATENVTALRPLCDEEALAWLRSQGKITTRPAELGRRFGWTRQRTGRRLDAWKKAGQIKRRGHVIIADIAAGMDADKGGTSSSQAAGQKPHGSTDKRRTDARTNPAQVTAPAAEVCHPVRPGSPVPPSTPPASAHALSTGSLLDAAHTGALYVAAIAATVTAAYFSVTGWAVIFPGEPIGAMAFDAVMETLKIAAAGFLAACWRTVLPFWRVALMCFIIAVAGINGLGVYSQLVAAHISDRTVASTDAAATANREVVRLTALVISQRAAVENVSQQIRTHDDAVAKATTARPKAAMQIIADSRAARDKLTTQYEAATKALTMWAGIAPGAEYPVGARDQARQREAG